MPRTETLSVENNRGDLGLLDMRTEASVRTTTVTAGSGAVWAALPYVFTTLGIPTTTVEVDGLVIGNTGFSARTIEEQRMSRYVDCGLSSGRPRADQYQVTLYVVVQLSTAADAGTVVSTFFDAYANSRGVSGNAVHCVTTGRLERRIMELIMESAGLPG